MFKAVDQNGQITHADLIAFKSDLSYFCPGCRAPVILKKGEINRPHFAHVSGSDCPYQSEPETVAHLNGKITLAQALAQDYRGVELEYYLPNICQRADIYVHELNLAIEYQCSPLTFNILQKRIAGYQSLGIQALWVLGEQLIPKKRLSTLHRAMMNSYFGDSSLAIYDHCAKIYYDFQINQKSQINFKQNRIEIGDLLSHKIFANYTDKDHQIIDVHYDQLIFHQENFMRKMAARDPKIRGFCEFLYQNRLSWADLPVIIFMPLPHDWMVKDLPELWKTRLYLQMKDMTAQKGNLERLAEKFIQEKLISYHYMPYLSEEYFKRPVRDFLACLLDFERCED